MVAESPVLGGLSLSIDMYMCIYIYIYIDTYVDRCVYVDMYTYYIYIFIMFCVDKMDKATIANK
jgi:hypothetical protein